MDIRTMVLGEFMTNCFVVWKRDAALIVDPAGEPAKILRFLERQGLSVAAYLLTHGHADHAGALADVFDVHPAPVALHAADLVWAFETPNPVLPMLPSPRRPGEIARVLQGGETFEDADIRYEVISTPGHTPGSVCFRVPEEDAIFCGDTLFAGSVGRTDFFGGDTAELKASLRRLCRLPGKTTVYTGHGPSTSLDVEKQSNPFLLSRD